MTRWCVYFVATLQLVTSLNVELQQDECRRDVEKLVRGIKEEDSWAIQMLDASAKLPSGVLRGNIRALGDYDECVELQGSSPVSPQFCLADIHVHDAAYPRLHELLERATLGRREREIMHNRTGYMVPNYLPMFSHIQAGVCVPASCGPRDTEMLISSMLGQAVPKEVSISAELGQGACSGPQSKYRVPRFAMYVRFMYTVAVNRMDPSTLTRSLFFSLIVLLSLVGTTFDLLLISESQDSRWIRAFSLKANWSTLSDRGFISCLEGLRALSVFGVIMEHEIFQVGFLPIANKFLGIESVKNPEHMILVAFVSADNFFVISGLLRVIQLLKEFDRNNGCSARIMWNHAIRRYLRITPALMVTILVYVTILPSLGSGPLWYEYAVLPSQACRRNWYLNMFYVNHYVERQITCADQTWYLAADWNMFLLAPLLVWSIWRWRHLALHILTGTTLLSTAGVFVYSYVTKAMPSMLISGSDAEHLHYTLNIYRTAHHRIAAYVIGIGLGFIFHYINNSQLKVEKFSQSHKIFGWSAALVLMAFVVFGGYPLKQYEYHDRGFAAAFFGAVHRPLWALAIAWIIFACHQGFGGWINSFLSARFWLPLSRISLCISLLNPLVLLVNIGRMRSSRHLDEYELAKAYIGDCGISVIISFLLYLMVEAPASRLVTLALPGRKPTSRPKSVNGEKKHN